MPVKHNALMLPSDYVRGPVSFDAALDKSRKILGAAIATYRPTHVVSMVSGGKDSACSHAVADEILGGNIHLIVHGNTRCGIPETSQFVERVYGAMRPDLAIADAGTAYEDYVLRKGFFGKGISAHAFAYRVLKATPFRKVISKYIRKRRRNIRVLLLNGARQDESENRRKNLQVFQPDPAMPNNIWTSIIFDWSVEERDSYLADRGVPINEVAKVLCRSGECMCGTMQSDGERLEAAVMYPEWGKWLDNLEAEARRLHGFGWGEAFPRKRNKAQGDMFQPMCSDCVKNRQ